MILCKPFFFLLVDSFEVSAAGAVAAGLGVPGAACETPEPAVGVGCTAEAVG